MRKTVLTVAFIAIWLTAALLGGCAGCGYDEKKPLAIIDGKNVIRVGDFVYHYKRAVEMAPFQNKPVINTYEDAKDFLDDIITSRVLEMEAEALGYGNDEGIKRQVEDFRSNLLRDKVTQQIRDEVKVTEAEILDYYNKNKEYRQVSVIVCDKKEKAEEAYAALVKGKPWAEVVKEYSVDEATKPNAGAIPQPFGYTGDNVSRAIYATEVGKFTPVVAFESGSAWGIFRVEKKVPGRKDEYSKVKEIIREQIKNYKFEVRRNELVGKWRKEAKIQRDQELFEAVMNTPIKETKEKYDRKGKVISRVGNIPVPFDAWFEGTFLHLRMSEDGVEELRTKDSGNFRKFMEDRLRIFEDQALLEWQALRTGVDKTEEFNREVAKFRASLLVDMLYNKQFVPQIPPVTEEEVKEYFNTHQAEFQEPERADIFLIAVPDKARAEALYAQVKAGKDIMAVGDEFRRAYEAEMAKKEPPKQPPAESSIPIVDMLTVTKQPNVATTSSPDAAGGREPPFINELRPRIFAAKEGSFSELFQFKDGRWAMFKYIKYYPLVQHTLDEKGQYDRAKEGAYNEKMASPAVDRKCQAWFKSLRAKHKIEIDEGALKMAFKKVQKLQ